MIPSDHAIIKGKYGTLVVVWLLVKQPTVYLLSFLPHFSMRKNVVTCLLLVNIEIMKKLIVSCVFSQDRRENSVNIASKCLNFDHNFVILGFYAYTK